MDKPTAVIKKNVGASTFLYADCPHCGGFNSLGCEVPCRPGGSVHCKKCRKWFTLVEGEKCLTSHTST